MESPFYRHHNSSFVLYVEPILNTYFHVYQNVITLSTLPPGPLADMVTQISAPKLSPFQQTPPLSTSPYNCTFVLLRYPKQSGCSIKAADYFMTTEDIPAVLSYLEANGYTIDTAMTTMLLKSHVGIGGVSESTNGGNRKFVCSVRCQTAPG
jgi:hypothetical protein